MSPKSLQKPFYIVDYFTDETRKCPALKRCNGTWQQVDQLLCILLLLISFSPIFYFPVLGSGGGKETYNKDTRSLLLHYYVVNKILWLSKFNKKDRPQINSKQGFFLNKKHTTPSCWSLRYSWEILCTFKIFFCYLYRIL